MTRKDNINYIREQLSESELLAQLAEECAELAKASLKLRRVITTSSSPTPVSKEDAINDIAEEIADVRLCLKVLGYDEIFKDKIKRVYKLKCNRWVLRLRNIFKNK